MPPRVLASGPKPRGGNKLIIMLNSNDIRSAPRVCVLYRHAHTCEVPFENVKRMNFNQSTVTKKVDGELIKSFK